MYALSGGTLQVTGITPPEVRSPQKLYTREEKPVISMNTPREGVPKDAQLVSKLLT